MPRPGISIIVLLLAIANVATGQARLITGQVYDSDGKALPTVSVVLKQNISQGTITSNEGTYNISVPSDSAILVFSHVGYGTVEEHVGGRTAVTTILTSETTMLNEVVVIGYGTQNKSDLTGAISSVHDKDFNQGNFTAPDLLIQGRVAGVQITNTSGQPGVATTIKVRGNSVLTGTGQPLFVVDGVPLNGSSPRPNSEDGDSPLGNPLNFINPSDIASIDVLKDASATAIYGSRAAYGVVAITTKKGQTGEPQIDFNASSGLASIQHKVKILDASQYRDAIQYYNVSSNNDKGGNSDGLASILRTAKQQNYNLSVSGGNANGKYRISIGHLDQEGIIRKSDIKKYTVNLSTSFKFLESKRLGMDFNLIASQYVENIPVIRNHGSIIGAALFWNPTDSLRNRDGSIRVLNSDIQSPLALSEYYNDKSKVSTILASIAPHYEITDWLDFKIVASINYGSGVRRASVNQLVDFPSFVGSAKIFNNENTSSQITNTLTFNKEILPELNITAIAGYEYLKSSSVGSTLNVAGDVNGFGNFGVDYTNYIQYSNPSNRMVSSFANPISELQSYFGRAIANYKSKYLLTATFRADGSSKFGKDNKYGYFPSFSGSWVLSEEAFFKSTVIKHLKLRMGWGKTGNQEFPSGSSVLLYGFSTGLIGQINNPNPNLKWQADQQFNIGVDFALVKNKITGTIDYFRKTTTDLLYPSYPIQPAPPASIFTWINLDGKIRNSGLEASINTVVVDRKNLYWNVAVNATLLKNNVTGLPAPILTGMVANATNVQVIKNGSPINSFYVRRFLGIDKTTGLSKYEDDGNTSHVVGNPNPKVLLGASSVIRYKKVSLDLNMYGAFGQSLYNSTLNSTLNVGHINTGQNIALSEFRSNVKESYANPVEVSSRYIERADYFKLSNATLAYDFGIVGKSFKQPRVYFTAQNLFVITRYSGFTPEVNIDRNNNGIPSLGIDNHAYPLARTFILGLKFSL